MMSSPSLRSLLTVKSAESVSPSAGSAFCAGAQPAGTASASAHAEAMARCRQRRTPAVVLRGGRVDDIGRGAAAAACPSPRMMQRKHFSFVSTMVDPADARCSLTHFDAAGQAHMVDVAAKGETRRTARATGTIRMLQATLALIAAGSAAKGDVLGVARIAAIQGAKKTSELVPLCHPIALTRVGVEFELVDAESAVRCTAEVETIGRTGVEME